MGGLNMEINMSKKEQYFMYGILVQHSWYKAWKTQTGRSLEGFLAEVDQNDDAGDISCYFDTRDGKFIIIGKRFEMINDGSPIEVPELTVMEKYLIELSISENFNLEGDFHYYFIKNYK